MKLYIVAVGKNMPAWVSAGFLEYIRRLPADYETRLIEISAEKRTKKADIQKIIATEETKIKAAIPKNALCIALDRMGKTISTEALAENLQTWHDNQEIIYFVIGGPEGLSKNFLNKANAIWSLSALTLPHPLVRVVLAEQLYRAWSMNVNHPYHR